MNVRFTYKLMKHSVEPLTIETGWVSEQDGLVWLRELEKSATGIEVEDDLGSHWTPKQFRKLMEKTKHDKKDAVVYFDANYDKEQQLAGLGAVIYYSENGRLFRVRENKRLTGMESNNEAEYAAFHFAIQLLATLEIQHQLVTVKGDSLVVINQFKGEWPCYEPVLSAWLDRIEQEIEKCSVTIQAEAIKREKNQEANRLASQALNNEPIRSVSEVEE